MVVQLVNKQAV